MGLRSYRDQRRSWRQCPVPLAPFPWPWPSFLESSESGRVPHSGLPHFWGLWTQHGFPSKCSTQPGQHCPGPGHPKPFCFPGTEAPLGTTLSSSCYRETFLSGRLTTGGVSRRCGPETSPPFGSQWPPHDVDLFIHLFHHLRVARHTCAAAPARHWSGHWG